MRSGASLVPESASTFAPAVDMLFWSLVVFAFGLGLFLTILVIVYSVRYRASAAARWR
jgi:heme/copper-type cytochrome/quinol oxidase subunit 2